MSSLNQNKTIICKWRWIQTFTRIEMKGVKILYIKEKNVKQVKLHGKMLYVLMLGSLKCVKNEPYF